MSCQLCDSNKQMEFSTEINIHLSGVKNIDDPGVLFFPKVLVCLDCGASHFSTPGDELLRLSGRAVTLEASAREGRTAGSCSPRITSGA